jgi:hypothetical protein
MKIGKTFLFLSILSEANGFLTTSTSIHRIRPNRVSLFKRDKVKVKDVGDPTGFNSFRKSKDVKLMKTMPLGEAQRPFRRTIYTHDDWKKHRSQDRFFYYVLSMFNMKSGVYKNLSNEVAIVTFIATSVCLINGLTGGYTDLEGIEHAALLPLGKVGIPLSAFTLTSPSLGLLLGKLSCFKYYIEQDQFACTIFLTRDIHSLPYQYSLSTLGRSS